MAAEEHSGVSERLVEGSDLTTNHSVEGHVTPNMTDEEILNQAFVDAAEFSGGVEIHYSDEGMGLREGSMITTNDEGVTFITSDSMDPVSTDQLSQFTNGTFQVLTAGQVVGTDTNYTQEVDVGEAQVVDGESALELDKMDNNEAILSAEQAVTIAQSSEPLKAVLAIPQGTPVSLTSGAPLGSSQNPIRIIQQGNQYTPVQQLSTDQLQQIMQVVQQQQMANSVDGGSSVLFNPQTNTRIVYRVIYPSELHKDKTGVTSTMQTAQSIQTTPKKVYRKRNKEEESEMREGPSLSKEEKEMRKKARAKTRSGRVSKPPKHMVKDFKHIHVLDYDEDYDDSDGGYSDYKVEESDDDDNSSRKDENEAYVVPGLNATKPKNWKCVTCEKAYIGRAGLGRHLKLNPTHGSIDVEGEGDMVPPPPGTEIVMNGSSSADNTPNVLLPNGTPNGIANSTASLSEDSRDSSYSLPYTPTPSRRGNARGRPRGSRGWRGRWAYNKMDPELRRRNKLKDLVRECSDEELMEIVLPRLAKVITLWEFLLMKVERGDPARPHVDDVYIEYEKLHASVRKLCQEYLQLIPDMAVKMERKVLHVENAVVAEALGLQTGPHTVKEIADMDTSDTYNYKLLTTNQSVVNKPLLKRTVEVVSPEQIVSPSKKLRNGPLKLELSDSAANGNLCNNSQSVILSVSSSNSASSQPVILSQSSSATSTSVILSNSSTEPVLNIQPAANLSTKQLNIQPGANLSTKHLLDIQPGTNSSILNIQPLVNPSTKHVLNIEPSTNSSTKHVINFQPTHSSTITSYSNAVSLLSNSVLSPVPFQSQNTQPSQKIIVVSGLNPSRNVSSLSGTQSILQQTGSQSKPSHVGEVVNVILPVVKTETDSQELIQSHNNLLEPGSSDSVTVNSSIVDQSSAINNSSGMVQQLYFTIPESSSQSEDSPDNRTKHVCQISPQNENNEMNTSLSQNGTSQEILIDSSLVNENTESENLPNNDMGNTFTSNEDESEEVFVVQSGTVIQNTQCEPEHTESTQNDIVNIAGTQSDTVILTATQSEIRSDHTIPTTDSDQILGVASIDNSDTTDQVQTITEPIECDSQPDQTSDLSTQIYETVEAPGSVSIQDMSVEYVNESSDQTEFYQYETNSVDPDQAETVQLPTTNIYQLEDGAIFIQNQDGTLIQLQGSDGQNASMEAVQAFLASNGNGQFIDNSEIYNQSEQT